MAGVGGRATAHGLALGEVRGTAGEPGGPGLLSTPRVACNPSGGNGCNGGGDVLDSAPSAVGEISEIIASAADGAGLAVKPIDGAGLAVEPIDGVSASTASETKEPVANVCAAKSTSTGVGGCWLPGVPLASAGRQLRGVVCGS